MRIRIQNQLKNAAIELEKAYKLKHGRKFMGTAPGHWSFSATWLPYKGNIHYANTCWYIRAIYVILHQRAWAMDKVFGLLTVDEFHSWNKTYLDATNELWYEYSPKAMIEAGLLLPENGTH